VVLKVLTVPLGLELVHCRGLGPHCSSGTGHKVGTLEPVLEGVEVFLMNWKFEEEVLAEARGLGKVQVWGDIRGILCCTHRCRRLGDERSSLAEVPRVQGSYCSQGPRGVHRNHREVHQQVSGQEDRREGSPGREVHSCLGGEGEEEEDLQEGRKEDHQDHQDRQDLLGLLGPLLVEDSCCSWCVGDGEEGDNH